jgi:hypothetical protein
MTLRQVGISKNDWSLPEKKGTIAFREKTLTYSKCGVCQIGSMNKDYVLTRLSFGKPCYHGRQNSASGPQLQGVLADAYAALRSDTSFKLYTFWRYMTRWDRRK